MSRNPLRQAFLLLVPLCLAGLTAARGAEAPPKAPAAAAVEVHLKEYTITMPKTLPAGPTTFSVHDDGAKAHSFKIEGPGVEELLAKPLHPGETGTLQVTLQPGEYKVYCPIGSHSAKGMSITLTVTAKPAP
jgi:uncharacterized cupredoxin-like copper-binding protein